MDERIEMYRRMTGFTPSIYQQDLIESRVDDIPRWQKAIEFWCGNDYRPQSVLKVIEYYEGLENGINHKHKYPAKRTDADVWAESEEFYRNYPS